MLGASSEPRKRRGAWVLALPRKLSPLRLTVLAVLVTFLALSLATPLRAYFQQRAELQQLSVDIAQKKERKEQLEQQIDQYNNDDYVREQARLRLGMINKGETAWRIMDPNIPGSINDSASATPTEAPLPWYTNLLNSIKTDPATASTDDAEVVPTDGAAATSSEDPEAVPTEGDNAQTGEGATQPAETTSAG